MRTLVGLCYIPQRESEISDLILMHGLYLDSVFDCIEQYAPGFKASIVGKDVLTPPDLEEIFGLTGGVCFTVNLAYFLYLRWL